MLQIAVFLLVILATGIPISRSQEIQRSAVNYWRFDHSTNYTDSITNTSGSYHGNTNDVAIQGSRLNNGYLFLKSKNSTLTLSGIASLCLAEPQSCHGGVTLAMWFLSHKITNDEVSYITSDSNMFSMSHLGKGCLTIRVVSGYHTYETCVIVNTSLWTHLTVTWQSTNEIAVFANSRLLSKKTVVTKVTDYWNNTSQSQSTRNSSLVLHGIASYDDVMVWNKVLTSDDIKRIFQSQIKSIFHATCHAQVKSLNITWQTSLDVYGSISSYHARLRHLNQGKTLVTYKLPKTATGVVFRGLDPITSYRIKIWAKTRDNGAGVIKTQVVKCTTLEGVSDRVLNLRGSSILSSAILVKWLPPFRIDGYLKGYQVTVSRGFFRKYFFVDDKRSLTIDKLQENTTYIITVAAMNTKAMGQAETIRVKTKPIPIIIHPPEGSSAVSNYWNTISVKWDPMNVSYEADFYDIRVCQDNNYSHCKNLTTNLTWIDVKDLQQNTHYVIDVRGMNSRSKGPWVQHVIKTGDMDECTDIPDVCGYNSLCKNTPGSYLCSCLPGHVGNGSHCIKNDVGLESVCPFEIHDGLVWNSVFIGQYAYVLCPKGTVGKVERLCSEKDGKPIWGSPNLEKCISHRLLDLQEQLSSADLNSTVLISLVSDLISATSTNGSLPIYGGDIVATVNIVQQLCNFTIAESSTIDESSQNEFSQSAIQVSSNIVDSTRDKGWNGLSKSSRMNVAYQLVETLESITLATASYSETQVTHQAPNIIAKMQSFPVKSDSEQLYVAYTSNCTISLPVHEASNNREENKTRVSFIYLSNIGRLLSSNNRNQTTSGEVTSLSMEPKPVGSFTKPVVITLPTPQHQSSSMQPTCVFWNSTSDPPFWSSEGCELYSSNSSLTVCHCYHLTSFAVLMEYVPTVHSSMASDHTFALSLITYIGVGISLVSLLLAFITFTFCPFLKSTRNFAHINLTLSLLLAEGLFLAGIDKTNYGIGCQLIAAFLHYLFLVVFCWMGSEGIILYFMLVRVFPSEANGPRRRLFFISSWGLPCILVVLAYSFYPQGYTNPQYCWLTVHDGFIWSFLAPVIVIGLVNLIFLGMTFKAMSNRLTPQTASKRKTFRHWAKACGVITCLLGTTWLLGLFFVNNSSLVMAYLFNIFNGLQGLFIFIFHCVFDERVRAEYCRVLCCRGSRRDLLRKMSTDPQTSRHKMTPTSSRQKYIRCSTDEEKGTLTGMTMSSLKHYMDEGFDSDSLLTINKTSTEEYGLAADNSFKKADTLNSPKEHPEKLWENESPENRSRPLSLDGIPSKNLERSKEYYSDSDCANYFSDTQSDEIGSHPKLQDSKGGMVKLGRCRICSSDCYHMVCIGNDDGLTLDSFESEHTPYRSLNFVVTESDETQESCNFPSTRISFDESILTGFLRDAHPNPKIINHRWTHIPYIREKDLQSKDFLTEASSCDDRIFNRQQYQRGEHAQETPHAESKARAYSVGSGQNTEPAQHAQNEVVEELVPLQKPEKPVGLVSPMLLISAAKDQCIAPVATVDSIEELDCETIEQKTSQITDNNEVYETNLNSKHDITFSENNADVIDMRDTSKQNTPSLNSDSKSDTDHMKRQQNSQNNGTRSKIINLDSSKDNQDELALVRSLVESSPYPAWHTTLHTIQYQDVPEHSLHTHEKMNIDQGENPCGRDRQNVGAKSSSESSSHSDQKSEMAAIKEGLVRQLGEVYEKNFLILHPVTKENEHVELRPTSQSPKTERQVKRSSKLLPGKVKFLRAIFEDPAS